MCEGGGMSADGGAVPGDVVADEFAGVAGMTGRGSGAFRLMKKYVPESSSPVHMLHPPWVVVPAHLSICSPELQALRLMNSGFSTMWHALFPQHRVR